MAPAAAAAHTTWHSRDGHYALPPIGDARELLQALLALYRDGLHRPLHFFPKSAWKYMTKDRSLAQGRAAPGKARSSAPTAKTPTRRIASPCAAWTTRSTTEFEQCAATVFGPLLDVITDDRIEARA